jgi:hypothetical protein
VTVRTAYGTSRARSISSYRCSATAFHGPWSAIGGQVGLWVVGIVLERLRFMLGG